MVKSVLGGNLVLIDREKLMQKLAQLLTACQANIRPNISFLPPNH